MERTLSAEEKIRRAEEIYERRRSGYNIHNVATVNVSKKKNYSLFKKMILQIAICLLIYFIFYLIQNSNYVFSEEVINRTKEILSYDINIQAVYSEVMQQINNLSQSIIVDTQEQNENNINKKDIDNSIENTIDEDAMGGAEIQDVLNEMLVASAKESLNQGNIKKEQELPLTDNEYIKTNYSFIRPIEGIVSSEFGLRNVDNPIVSKNHSGIDIAANTGTVIKAAMEGTVTVSSTVGDYGHHIKITNGDVSTLYAHCSKLYVKEGETIKQGQEIAEVGTTGKSTGPHLHFEITRGTTYINPRDILEF